MSDRDRDELWCRAALAVLDMRQMQALMESFNALRASAPSPAVPATEAELERYRAAVSAFLDKWALVEPKISGAFAFMQIHGNTYSGPTIEKELAALRALVRPESAEKEAP